MNSVGVGGALHHQKMVGILHQCLRCTAHYAELNKMLMNNTVTIDNYCDISTGHWKLRYFSSVSIYLTEEYMSFLDIEEWDALDVVDNGDGTLTLKKG